MDDIPETGGPPPSSSRDVTSAVVAQRWVKMPSLRGTLRAVHASRGKVTRAEPVAALRPQAQHLRHVELGVAAFQVVAHFVRVGRFF